MATIPGTGGNDTLLGTADDDLIEGGAGNDLLNGGAGSDTVDGGTGADMLFWDENPDGSSDHDIYHGGTGDEGFDPSPYTHQGGDTLNLGHDGTGLGGFHVVYTTASSGTAQDAYGNSLSFDGLERTFTGGGNDFLDASGAVTQDDVGIRVYTGGGNDTILGSSATDYIRAGDGDDLIHAGDGNDVVEGGAGDDTIYGEGGNDGLRWGDGGSDAAVGNDVYYGGTGYNSLNAWQYDSSGHGVQMILDTSSSGTVTATGAATGHLEFHDFQNLLTGHGNDTVDGSAAGVDGFRVYTAWGDDSIIGSAGDDTIEGGYGADTIDAGAGNDLISMVGDLFAAHAWDDISSDLLVLRDGFGHDTVRAFTIEPGVDQWGNAVPVDRLDVSGLHDADGNPVDLNDVTIGSFTDPYGNIHAQLQFPNGETLVLYEVDPAALTRAKLHELGIPCLCRGTLIATDCGPMPVEQLSVGSLVMTRDHGLQPIRWIGSRRLDQIDLTLAPRLRPIHIRAGALGGGLPARDLWVSPQHRMLVSSAIARRMFGCSEVLVAARQLLALDGVAQDACLAEVEYFHLLFDAHEIILANGAPTESLYLGDQAMRALGPEARAEILTLFPQLEHAPPAAARPLVTGAKARQLATRHARNGKALSGDLATPE